MHVGSPGGASGKASACNAGDVRDSGSILGSGRFSRGGHGNPLQFLPGESHGQRNLSGCSSWGHKESDTTEAPNTYA